MNIQPLLNRIVIKRADIKTTTDSGIIIPDVAKEAPQQGVVIAVGPGKRLDNGEFSPTVVQVGDIVLYGKSAGSEIKFNDEVVFIMYEDDIMGIIKP